MHFAVDRAAGDGKVVKLELEPPERLAALQERIADPAAPAAPVTALHVTLGHADVTGPFPDAPDFVETLDVPEAVVEGAEASAYLRLAAASAQAVASYVRRAAAALGWPGLVEGDRILPRQRDQPDRRAGCVRRRGVEMRDAPAAVERIVRRANFVIRAGALSAPDPFPARATVAACGFQRACLR
jgi:hypothetical protein